jgi:hypothetical protein
VEPGGWIVEERMSDNPVQAQTASNLSQRATEWKQCLEEAADIIIDFITLMERVRNLCLRATRKCAE